MFGVSRQTSYQALEQRTVGVISLCKTWRLKGDSIPIKITYISTP